MKTNPSRHFRSELLGLGGAIAMLAGCATTAPTTELVSARSAYAEATSGAAGKYAPADVQEAQLALKDAETAHADDPGSPAERDIAYVAWRKAQLAIVHGSTKASAVDSKRSEDRYTEMQDELRHAAEGSLDASEASLDKTQDKLASEKTARLQAEKQLAAAIQALADIGKVKQEGDSMTITLDGAVLFETDKSTLLPMAMEKLQKVADVLVQQGEGKTVVVLGHTDSSGADAYNQTLSMNRAESVRTFLVSRGVAASSIESKGFGETQPITGNDTPEGRANNRRVEIVVSNKK